MSVCEYNPSDKYEMIQRFLLVDDDQDDLELFVIALKKINSSITCYCAMDGCYVMGKLNTGEFKDPQIIFMDINMPEMDGWKCLQKLKLDDDYKHIPVIMYSTSRSPLDARRALEMNALCYFSKPSSLTELTQFLSLISHCDAGNIQHSLQQFKDLKLRDSFIHF
jgi:CheY-like chemotaxis protein